MNTQPILIRETSSPAELAKLAVDAVTRGDVDPLVAYENISRMEKAIELFKKSEEVRDITLRELAKYGHGRTSSDCTIEEVEAGVKYDYSGCNCQALDDLYKMRDAVMADIKEKEKILRALPASGLTDPATGEIFYPPARSSKTTLKVTFKNDNNGRFNQCIALRKRYSQRQIFVADNGKSTFRYAFRSFASRISTRIRTAYSSVRVRRSANERCAHVCRPWQVGYLPSYGTYTGSSLRFARSG